MRQYRYDALVVTFARLRLWSLLAVVCAAASCSSADNTPPVASLSVTTSKTQLVPGGVFEATYRFEVLPGARLPLDYTVFVQVANEDGQIIWSDDHQPEVPTSQWTPGRVVEYTRTRFLPRTGLAPGDGTMRVGLYRDNERLPLQSGDAQPADRAYPVASLRFVPESNGIFVIYTSGWYPEEFSDDGARSWTWTQQAATLAFKNPRRDVLFVLEYDARPDVFPDGPQQIRVSAGGQEVATFVADANTVALRRIPIPAAVLGSDEMSEVRLEVDRVFVPASLPAGGRDTRPLGIRVYHAVVESR